MVFKKTINMNILDNDLLFEDEEYDALVVPRILRRIYERADYFHSFEEKLFFQRFRVTKPTALDILNLIEDQIEFLYDTNNSVAPMNQLLIFLRFLATGTHLSCIGDFGGVHLSTVSRIIVRVGRALARLYNRFIKMPHLPHEINESHLKFYEKARFPRVIGAIDCTHVKIQSPGGQDAEIFRNRKGYFSLNVQVIGNADLKLMNVVARWPGSSHDATIFNNSRIKEVFQNNRFANSVILGDSGYNIRPYLLTPIQEPTTREEQLYNESHIRTRNVIERIIGVWKRRFPVLAYGCRLKLDTILTIIIASAVLYNICRELNEEEPPDPEDMGRFLQVMEEDQVPEIPPINQDNPNAGNQVRRDLIVNYFRYIEE